MGPMRALAISVHVFTAFGAVLALLALLAAVDHDWRAMFLWLGAALVVDGRFDVENQAARWSGDTLDLVVDYTTYVFVPAYAVAASELMPAALALFSAAAILLSGALYFADTRMKTEDNHFVGFPGLWNAVAFYLLLLKPMPLVGLAAVLAFAALSFAPVKFIHPVRVRRFRTLSLGLLGLWSLLALGALLAEFEPHGAVTAALCAIAAYFLVIGLFTSRRGTSPQA